MRFAQRLSSAQDLEFRYSWRDGQECYATVDGSLVTMQALLEPLVVGCFSHAEASTGFGGLQKRRSIAHRFTRAYAEGLGEISDFVAKVSEDFGGTPTSYSSMWGKRLTLWAFSAPLQPR